jgi:membrane-bound ClpP family serine protease
MSKATDSNVSFVFGLLGVGALLVSLWTRDAFAGLGVACMVLALIVGITVAIQDNSRDVDQDRKPTP